MIKKILKWFVILMLVAILVPVIFITIIGGGFGERSSDFLLNEGNPTVYAHRGMTNYYAENSMESFIQCEKMGFNAIEIDIRITKDNRLMVFHDESCKRLLGIDGNISEMNAEEFQDLHLIHKDLKTDNKVLSLDQFLKKFKDSQILYLDIKDNSKTVADSLLNYFKGYNIYNTVLVADESFIFLSYIKLKDPKIQTVLEGFNAGREWYYYLMPRNFKPDFYSSFLFKVDENHMKFLKANDLLNKKIVYSVTHENIVDVYELGIQNIILDYDTTLGSISELELRLKNNSLN